MAETRDAGIEFSDLRTEQGRTPQRDAARWRSRLHGFNQLESHQRKSPRRDAVGLGVCLQEIVTDSMNEPTQA
jgi:hypothetical protein